MITTWRVNAVILGYYRTEYINSDLVKHFEMLAQKWLLKITNGEHFVIFK